jgi:hypothetical protein
LANMDSDFVSEDFFLMLGQAGTHYGLRALSNRFPVADCRV